MSRDDKRELMVVGVLAVLAMLFILSYNASAHTLTINVVDDVTGEHLTFRGHCLDALDTARYPLPTESCLMHTISTADPVRWPVWWYADSPCTLSIPVGGEGTVTVGAGHGFEYRAETTTVAVTADTEITLRLTPLTDMSTLGWYSGDTADLTHTPVEYTLDEQDALWACEAEGLNVYNSEDGGDMFTGTPVTDGDRICYVTYEMRHQRYGHSVPLGARSAPDSTTWAQNLAPCIYDLADTVRARDADVLLVAVHPSEYGAAYRETDTNAGRMWPREVMVDAFYDKIDAYDIMWHSSGYTPTRYYHLLNTGAQITPTGGTDAALSKLDSGPPGGMKTYAHTTDYNYRNWVEAVRDGRVFATNGPIITTYTVDGEMSGSTLAFPNIDTETLDIVLEFESGDPVKRIEYIVNGAVQVTQVLATGRTAVDTTATVDVEYGGAWVAARLIGDDPGWFITSGEVDTMVALTGPVYVTMAGLDVNVPASAEYLGGWCDSLLLVTDWLEARGTCVWSSESEETRVEAIFQAASDAYATKAAQTTYTVGSGGDYATLWLALDTSTGCDPFDTLVMLDGIHAGGGARAVPNGVTIRSLGPDHKADCIIRNIDAANPGVTVDSLTIIRDITFRTDAVITNSGIGVVKAAGAAADLRMYNCNFQKCIATQRNAALRVQVAEQVILEGVVFDSCGNTGADQDYSVAYVQQVQNFTWTDGRITNCSSVDRAPFVVASDATWESLAWDNILIAGNSSANYGTVWFTGGQAGDVFYLDHITVVGNTCTDAGDGPIEMEGANLFSLKHSIMSGGASNPAFKATTAPDTMHYCNLYGNGADVAYGDTTNIIKVDPEYTTTDLAQARPYMTMSIHPSSGTSSPRATADGSYMGWLDPPGIPSGGSGLMGRLYRRRH